jgi:predicted CoA-binding protein
VPAFLKAHGYHIIPVNPKLSEALGEKAYPDLDSVPEKIDEVLIFRPGETVVPIAEAAVRKGAHVVWMQEGIRNDEAAKVAREAGLLVVMDTCMRSTYKRLIGE